MRWKGDCGNVTSSFYNTGCNRFGDSWGEGQGTIAVVRKENQHAYFQGYQYDPGPTGSFKWHCWKVRRHETSRFRGSWPEM